MKIPGTFSQAVEYIKKYEHLSRAVDFNRLEMQFRSKYSTGLEINDTDVYDLIVTALLAISPEHQHIGRESSSPEMAFINMETCIREMALDLGDNAKKLSNILINLKTSNFWDLLTSLLLAKRIVRVLPQHRVNLSFPLGTSKKLSQNVFADVAIHAPNGSLELLIDASTPPAKFHCIDFEGQTIEWISKIYDDKFADYCNQNTQTKVAIVVSLYRNENIFYRFLTKEQKYPYQLQRNGLAFAIACNYKSITDTQLIIQPVAEYFAPSYAAVSRIFL